MQETPAPTPTPKEMPERRPDERKGRSAPAARPRSDGYFRLRRLQQFLKKALSFRARRRRFGAGPIFAELSALEFAALKGPSTVDHPDPVLGSNRADLADYLKLVEREFLGQPELLLLHAKLIVLIRREYKTKQCFALFSKLWHEEAPFLLQHLDMRWLLSANDTFLDLSEDREERLTAGWSVILANGIKLTETERLFSARDADPDRLAELRREPRELFDGMRSFWIGREDTLFNMRRRLELVSKATPVHQIFWELFARMQEENTVYSRFRALHEKPRTEWW